MDSSAYLQTNINIFSCLVGSKQVKLEISCILLPRAGALVWWLMEVTHYQMVVSSNPSAGYWMDIFHIICFKIVYCLKEKDANKRKRGRGCPIKKHISIAVFRTCTQCYEQISE